jgi:hypothetical protein
MIRFIMLNQNVEKGRKENDWEKKKRKGNY